MTESQGNLLRQLVERIFEAEVKNHNREMDLVIDENSRILGHGTDGFNHLGNNYGRNGALAVNQPSLSASLVPQVNKLLRYRQRVQFDSQLVYQCLMKLIQPCETLQDIRDALPECVVSLVDYLARMPRTREPAWNVKNPRDLRLYEKSLTKIQSYCAMKYLY